ncbi:lasso peptide biosynthesis PqqD family chaperone [Streptomyces iconiensis]|uniref:Lasso peptide biosynthesis PqqD family chaperone n=1 Tax=Streptomyces iconiensis TaxID=1384038 RepID=A0ABT6ZV12_9ACTN|nr:lasso peptide biosynthesis PqqD family chaperone [Streptomyces iconiensis]MDJ1132891.1 lasso peptide biosynthesis PqqD family chaperone [Streptomyces iconiensis]
MTVRLKPHVSTAVTDNGMALLDETTGRYFELNGTGATVLTALLDGARPQELARRLSEGTTDADAERAGADIAAFVTCLTRQGLVQAVAEAAHETGTAAAGHGQNARAIRGGAA